MGERNERIISIYNKHAPVYTICLPESCGKKVNGLLFYREKEYRKENKKSIQYYPAKCYKKQKQDGIVVYDKFFNF
jgi:hypothetical protein